MVVSESVQEDLLILLIPIQSMEHGEDIKSQYRISLIHANVALVCGLLMIIAGIAYIILTTNKKQKNIRRCIQTVPLIIMALLRLSLAASVI